MNNSTTCFTCSPQSSASTWISAYLHSSEGSLAVFRPHIYVYRMEFETFFIQSMARSKFPFANFAALRHDQSNIISRKYFGGVHNFLHLTNYVSTHLPCIYSYYSLQL
ncbi:hypothetical protein FKM82_028611 [Ascaphus truei]